MDRRSAIRSLMTAGGGSLFLKVAAQEVAEEDFIIHSDVRLVLLDVSVKDRAGGFVAGLTKESFGVSENGVAQPITAFAGDDVPVTVGILGDESRSIAP